MEHRRVIKPNRTLLIISEGTTPPTEEKGKAPIVRRPPETATIEERVLSFKQQVEELENDEQ